MEYWKVSEAGQDIVITCRGHDKEGAVGAAAAAFNALVANREGDFRVIADLREMDGYETPSRVAWQGVFSKHRKRILGLVLVGARSPAIRMGAAVVGAFAGIPVKFVSSWDDLVSKQNVG